MMKSKPTNKHQKPWVYFMGQTARFISPVSKTCPNRGWQPNGSIGSVGLSFYSDNTPWTREGGPETFSCSLQYIRKRDYAAVTFNSPLRVGE